MTYAFKKALSLAFLASAVTLTSCQKEDLMEEQFNQASPNFSEMKSQPIEGQYIVVLKGGTTTATRTSALNAGERRNIKNIRQRLIEEISIDPSSVKETFDGAINGFAAKLSKEQLEKLKSNPEIAHIEQDRIISLTKPFALSKKSNSDLFASKGGRKPTTAPTEPAPAPTPTEPVPTEPIPVVTEPAPTTGSYTAITPLAGELVPWNITRVGYGDGTGKTAWIIDSGIDTDHPDLNIDLKRSSSFIYGVTSVEDGYGHGTVVAGIIAAKNNGAGIIGVASGATVVALRVFDDAGKGTISRAISAVNYVINVGAAGDVVNMSLGGGISSTLDNAVKTAAAKGIMFAIASGNSGTDCINNSPARVDATNVYTVTAMDRYDRFGAFSNFGNPVDFSAPGVNVTSTVRGGGISQYETGTSFAAPHVAGILLLQGKVNSNGTVTGDVDANPDAIAVLK